MDKKVQGLLIKGSYFLGTREQCSINFLYVYIFVCTKNVSQKRFANVLICEEKELYLAEPMEDFELHEDYFYIIKYQNIKIKKIRNYSVLSKQSSCNPINTSSYNGEKGNTHSDWCLLSDPAKLMKVFQSKRYPNRKQNFVQNYIFLV